MNEKRHLTPIAPDFAALRAKAGRNTKSDLGLQFSESQTAQQVNNPLGSKYRQ